MTVRDVTAGAVLASIAIHLTWWFQGMRDVQVIGPSFLVPAPPRPRGGRRRAEPPQRVGRAKPSASS